VITRRSIPLGRWASAAVVLLLVLGGCSSSSASQAPGGANPTPPPTTGAGAPSDAGVPSAGAPTDAGTAGSGSGNTCSLLTIAEVSAATGLHFDVANPSTDDNYYNCDYLSNDGSARATVFVARSAATSGYWATVKVNKGQPVSGVGDEAFWSTDSFLPGLYFLKGGVLAYISGSADGPQDSIIALGKLLAGRM
jgi:hypothetical protein